MEIQIWVLYKVLIGIIQEFVTREATYIYLIHFKRAEIESLVREQLCSRCCYNVRDKRT